MARQKSRSTNPLSRSFTGSLPPVPRLGGDVLRQSWPPARQSVPRELNSMIFRSILEVDDPTSHRRLARENRELRERVRALEAEQDEELQRVRGELAALRKRQALVGATAPPAMKLDGTGQAKSGDVIGE